MLYQLFAGIHPFQPQVDEVESMDESNTLIRLVIERRRILRLEEVAPLRAAQLSSKLLDMIHLAMDPDPSVRPTAADMHQALLNHNVAKTLVLKGGPAGLKWRIKETTLLSRGMCERFFGTELGAVSKEQGRFEPTEDRNGWVYIPRAETANASMVNGNRIDGQVMLETGMKLQVGNPISGNIGLEMEVSFE